MRPSSPTAGEEVALAELGEPNRGKNQPGCDTNPESETYQPECVSLSGSQIQERMKTNAHAPETAGSEPF